MKLSQNYHECLKPLGNGVALWIVEPDSNLSLELREKGVVIGDVGILNGDGGFDYMFNALLPASHPHNVNGVPEGFNHLDIGLQDIRSTPLYFSPGTTVSAGRDQEASFECSGKLGG